MIDTELINATLRFLSKPRKGERTSRVTQFRLYIGHMEGEPFQVIHATFHRLSSGNGKHERFYGSGDTIQSAIEAAAQLAKSAG